MASTVFDATCSTASGSSAGFVRDVFVYLDGELIGSAANHIGNDDPRNASAFDWTITYRIEGDGRVTITDLAAGDLYNRSIGLPAPEHFVASFDVSCAAPATTTTTTVPETTTTTTTTTVPATTSTSTTVPGTTTSAAPPTVPPTDPTIPPSVPTVDDPTTTAAPTTVAVTAPTAPTTTAPGVALASTVVASTVAQATVPVTTTPGKLPATGAEVFGLIVLGSACLLAGCVALLARRRGRKVRPAV